MQALLVKEKIMSLSSQLNASDMDNAVREEIISELVEWCEQYFILYHQLKTVPKLTM